MADLKIRAAFRADEAELADLDREMWSPLHAVVPRPQPYEPFFDDRHPAANFLVAEVDGRVAGYVGVGFATALAANVHVRQIRGLVVDHWARGQGVGRALVRGAVGRARQEGARRLTLRVLGHNAAARRLYEAEGFVVDGVLPGEFFLDGRYADDVLMGLTL
jgi:RimJ/RimL family protein N-acetyltransferase